MNDGVDLPCEILVAAEMPEERNLPQRPSCQHDAVEHPRDALDGECLPGQCVLNGDDEAVCALPERSQEFPP